MPAAIRTSDYESPALTTELPPLTWCYAIPMEPVGPTLGLVAHFEQWCDQIEVSSYSPRPDPDWLGVDSHGHEHRYSTDGLYRLPTLRWELDPGQEAFMFGDDGEEYNGEGAYHCVQCGDEVVPGSRGPSPYREFIPGLIHCAIDGVEVSKEEFDRRLAESREQG